MMIRARLHSLVALLLTLALPLQALAAVMPSWLTGHDHHATTAGAHFHTSHQHLADVALAPDPTTHHDASRVVSPASQFLADACRCAWRIACPMPVLPPPRPADPGGARHASVLPYLLYSISDLPHPPPRLL